MSKKTGFEHVREFHETFGHPIHEKPTVPDADNIKLRLALILEEFTELAEACVNDNGKKLLNTLEQAMQEVRALQEKDLDVDVVAVADALTDINYVTYGAGHCFGVDLDACMLEVQRANMSKLGPDGKPIYNEHGKVMKGPDYTPPNIASVILITEHEL
jgi:predicted HAD superfamily Cof-like phosphohydrolase